MGVRSTLLPPSRRALAFLPLPLAGGCRSAQSTFNPAADDAGRLLDLALFLAAGGTAIFLAVMALAAWAVWAPPRWRGWLAGRGAVVAAGVVFPTVALTGLLFHSLFALRASNAPAPASAGAPLQIEVTGEQFWWRVRYPADGDRPAFETANEIRVPAGRPVQVTLAAADVIHSFWIPAFAGKVDMIPGRRTALHFTPEREGVYRGLCGEFCGDQHARMAFDVHALDAPGFAAWARAQTQPAPPPDGAFGELGALVFARSGCGSCHAVRGTEHEGRLGPDLTHVGGRRTLGAGSYPNNAGTLAGWIADTQGLKAGARMPSYGALSGEELRAVAAYLERMK